MKNIFEGAKFGDRFLTKDGRIARFVCCNIFIDHTLYCLYTENEKIPYWYGNNGVTTVSKLDIVSNYQEPINEEKLDELAKEFIKQNSDGIHQLRATTSFKAGYKKCLEQHF